MIALACGFALLPIVDQGLKLLLVRTLDQSSLSLGPLGSVQLVRSRIWMTRQPFQVNLPMAWSSWFLASASLAVLTAVFPPCGWTAGLLIGAAFSHLLETTLRGCVLDYVRLRFWPAFNLADVAMVVGGIGIMAQLFSTTSEVWS